jgi:drug/metabolite transporter (DMT)-like permease
LLGALLVCGMLGGIGYLLQIAALSKAPASREAPTQYSQLVWALIYGASFFNEVPDAVGIAGLGLVVASGIANVFADGARARIAGRWAEYRGRREISEPTGFQGPGPDPV